MLHYFVSLWCQEIELFHTFIGPSSSSSSGLISPIPLCDLTGRHLVQQEWEGLEQEPQLLRAVQDKPSLCLDLNRHLRWGGQSSLPGGAFGMVNCLCFNSVFGTVSEGREK